jgi:beta-carotene 3-hydroxylase
MARQTGTLSSNVAGVSPAVLVMPCALVAVGFVAMEPITYALHRWVMHGAGWWLHESHHRTHHRRARGGVRAGLERNDAFPVIIGTLVCALLFAGFNVPALSWLVPVSVGVTLYGVVYAVVHDGAIHDRFPVPGPFRRVTRPLAEAHRLHHLYGEEPYGMLLPVIPDRVRARVTDRVQAHLAD